MSMDTLTGAELDDITNALAEAETETMAVVPESVFKEIYLPVFSGQVINNRVIQVWLHMVGGPLRRVRVVNDATGEVLFVVPSWYTTKHMQIGAPKDTSLPSFAETVAQAMMCITNNPGKATRMFEELTRKHLKESIDRGDSAQHNNEWAEIFARYGITFDNILANLKTHAGKGGEIAAPAAETAADESTGSISDGYAIEE